MEKQQVLTLEDLYDSEWCLINKKLDIGFSLGTLNKIYIKINDKKIQLNNKSVQIILEE